MPETNRNAPIWRVALPTDQDLIDRLRKTVRVLRAVHARYRAVWVELLACRTRIAAQRIELARMESALAEARKERDHWGHAFSEQKRRRQKLAARLRAAQTTIGAQRQYAERLEAEVPNA